MKKLICLIIITSITGIVLYPIFDIIWCKLITNSTFSYSVHQHIIEPIIFATIISVVLYLLGKK